jgi:hypothetical protein
LGKTHASQQVAMLIGPDVPNEIRCRPDCTGIGHLASHIAVMSAEGGVAGKSRRKPLVKAAGTG